jgi:DNA recombination protein RmuC
MDWLLAILGLVLGAGAGGTIGYLLADRKSRAIAQALQTAASIAEQRYTDLTARLAEASAEVTDARGRCSDAEKRTAALEADLRSAQQNLVEQRKLLDDAHVKLRDAFANVSAEALAKNNEAFLQLARERFATLSTEAAGSLDTRKAEIETLLKPMQEVLNQYQSRLGEIEKSRVESYSMLREQLGVLAETQRTLNTNTTQLVSALRRPNTRGQWGEVTLKRLVELAGMTNRCDFFEQASASAGGEDGAKIRPDMLVRLPGGREVVIDCKTSLDAFLDATSAPDEDSRKYQLQRHAQQVRARGRELCGKSYWTQFKNAPEFVVMFLPGEAFFAAAVEVDVNLYEDCLKSRVIVATPTTLLALLRSIEYGWKQADMTRNAEEIRKLGQELYERVVVMAGHFTKLGDSIGTAVNHYNSAIGSLESRVLVSARKMGELGAKTDKAVPELEPVEKQPRDLELTLRALSS